MGPAPLSGEFITVPPGINGTRSAHRFDPDDLCHPPEFVLGEPTGNCTPLGAQGAPVPAAELIGHDRLRKDRMVDLHPPSSTARPWTLSGLRSHDPSDPDRRVDGRMAGYRAEWRISRSCAPECRHRISIRPTIGTSICSDGTPTARSPRKRRGDIWPRPGGCTSSRTRTDPGMRWSRCRFRPSTEPSPRSTPGNHLRRSGGRRGCRSQGLRLRPQWNQVSLIEVGINSGR